MTAEILNKLEELVTSACDQLYAARQLITVAAVQKILMRYGLWSEEILERQLPGYINEWRINNLQVNSSNSSTELCNCKSDNLKFQEHINSLTVALIEKNLEIKALKESIIKNIRGLLSE